MNQPAREQWEAALARWLDGEPEPGDGELLALAMRQDPAALCEVSGLLAVDDLLRQHAELSPEDFKEAFAERLAARADRAFVRRLQKLLPSRAHGRWRRSLRYAAVAAIMAGIAMLTFFLRSRAQPEVATLLLTDQCEWQGRGFVEEGQRLVTGTLQLRKGLAVLRCDGGAELILRGDTQVELQSAGQARLVRGEVTVRAPEEAAGFKLLTPASEVIDLGTEFAAKVERSGATELHVLEGEVSCSSVSGGDPGKVVGAGQALRFESATAATPQPMVVHAQRFAEILREARPLARADLMFAYEGFSYRSGQVPFEAGNGGRGWRGPWRAAGANEAYRDAELSLTGLNIVHDPASIPWHMPDGQPGMLELPPGTMSLARTLERPIALDKDSVVYFSFVVREPDSAALVDREFGGVRLVFRSSANPREDMLSFGPTRTRVPGIRIGNGPNFTSPLQIARNQNTLWVGKINSRRSGAEDIFFSIYGERDTLDYAEPATWQVATRDVQRHGRLDLVVVAGQLSTACAVDEIRIGPTWRSVVPIQEPVEVE